MHANLYFQGSVHNQPVWSVLLEARPAGGPYNMNVKAPGETLILKDILFGDVWLCSGQSNMQFSIPMVCLLFTPLNKLNKSMNGI